jgi:hypothetical protein
MGLSNAWIALLFVWLFAGGIFITIYFGTRRTTVTKMVRETVISGINYFWMIIGLTMVIAAMLIFGIIFFPKR